MKTSTIAIESKSLRGNPLGDPTNRSIIILTPDRIKSGSPLLIGLSGFGGNNRSFLNFSPLYDGFGQIVDVLYERKQLNDAIIALPDGFAKVGGNQYINSSAVGNYEDFIIKDVIPYIKGEYDVGNIGVFGKSSGGFGSYTLAVRNPQVFSAFVDHSGDSGFEYSYISDFPSAADAFKKSGGAKNWLSEFWSREDRGKGDDMKILNALAMSAFYSPNDKSEDMGVDFPFDWNTGSFRDDVWERWLKWDPARNVHEYIETIEEMRGAYFDVGTKDEFKLYMGMRTIHNVLSSAGVDHFYEEFEGGHFNIQYRMKKSLPMLTEFLL